MRTQGITLAGFAVFALLALIPVGASFVPNGNGPAGYGMAEVVYRDDGGEVVSSQIIHNRLLDAGEALIIQGTFGTPLAAIEMPRVLCVGQLINSSVLETFPRGIVTLPAEGHTPLAPSCENADFDIDANPGQFLLNATFEGNTVVQEGRMFSDQTTVTLDSIFVCNSLVNHSGACGNAGHVFSVVGIDPQPVGANDTLDITYTFDLTSPAD